MPFIYTSKDWGKGGWSQGRRSPLVTIVKLYRGRSIKRYRITRVSFDHISSALVTGSYFSAYRLWTVRIGTITSSTGDILVVSRGFRWPHKPPTWQASLVVRRSFILTFCLSRVNRVNHSYSGPKLDPSNHPLDL